MTPNRTEEYLAMWTRVTVLYDEGQMADALQVVDAIERRFPERGAYLSSPRACLHAVMGDIDEAIRVIRDAIERGWWWSEGRVADPDLDPLRSYPEFRGLMAEMAQLRRRAHTRAGPRPAVAVFAPESGPARAIVIALHMHGTTAEETIPHWRTATAWGAVVAVPESTLNDAGGAPCWDDDRLAERDVRIALDEARRLHPVDESPVVLGGASQGAGHAVRLAMSGVIPRCRALRRGRWSGRTRRDRAVHRRGRRPARARVDGRRARMTSSCDGARRPSTPSSSVGGPSAGWR
jgi:hypothetical protein